MAENNTVHINEQEAAQVAGGVYDVNIDLPESYQITVIYYNPALAKECTVTVTVDADTTAADAAKAWCAANDMIYISWTITF